MKPHPVIVPVSTGRVHLTGTLTSAMFLVVFLFQRRFLRYYRKVVGDYYTTDDAKVSANLWKDLKHVSAIALPTVWSKEGLGSLVFMMLFAVKAALRVAQSTVDGDVLTTMVSRPRSRGEASASQKPRKYDSLRSAIIVKISVSLSAAVVSGCIEHLRHWLITAYRDRLTKYFHDRFYHKLVYYHGTVLDSRLEAADTVITNYCGEFAEHFAELPYYFLLPLLEAGTSLVALVKQSGRTSAGMMMSVVLLSLAVIRSVAPPFGRIHAAVLQREDDFRKMHTNAINNVEQVAMHNAGQFTKHRLNAQFEEVKTSLNEMSLAKGHFEMLEGTITAVWSAAAYAISSISSTVAGYGPKSKAERLSSAVVQLRLINDFNSSVKDFVINFRELSHLSEFTTKLAAFDETLSSVAQGNFCNDSAGFCGKRLLAASPAASPSSSSCGSPSLCTPETRGVFRSITILHRNGESYPLISFRNVDVANPKGVLLVSKLTLDFKSDQDWAIVGPNGCGKTSILRLLAKLWPPSSGSLTIDQSVSFCFLPQSPYLLPTSTIVEQICFPDEPVVDEGPLASADVDRKQISRKEQMMIKEAITLATGSAIIDHLGGWESPYVGLYPDAADRTFDWSSLSGGQRQKLAISRAFYHAKKAEMKQQRCICVLDESTSMMDHDAEQMVFCNFRKNGFRFVSVTHREEVLKHHTQILTLSRSAEEWSVSPVTREPL